MMSVLDLKDKGIGKEAVIIATGHSYLRFKFRELNNDVVRFEINKMRIHIHIDYSIYYDECWKDYFDHYAMLDRDLIGFRLHPINESNNLSKHCKYWHDTFNVPFSDTGFHCLYIASEIMKFKKIYLVGYDYCKQNGKWHPYNDDYIDDYMDKKKTECIDREINKYSDIKWNAEIFNCNKESKLKEFPFGLPYKN